MSFISMDELDALVASPWADIPQTLIPSDWRHKRPNVAQRRAAHRITQGECLVGRALSYRPNPRKGISTGQRK